MELGQYMVKVKEDLTGKVFDRLTVLRQAEDYINPKGVHHAQWLCECSCEEHNKVIVTGNSLRNKLVKSCGCIVKERIIELNKSRSKTNEYSEKLADEYGEYYIGYTNNTGAKFYIDAENYDEIKKHCWVESIEGRMHRISANIDGKMIRMHRFLGYKHFDHKDRNELNNRKYNLRDCTSSQNSQNKSKQINNTSGIIGVGWHKPSNRWRAYIKINGVQKELGYFADKTEAIKIRLKSEKEIFGEFAPQRHLFEQYGIFLQQKNLIDKDG